MTASASSATSAFARYLVQYPYGASSSIQEPSVFNATERNGPMSPEIPS
jgi:hypothetical protein